MTDLDRRGGGSSFLVRLWRESGGRGADEPARVYVRDLRSGEERYLRSLDRLADYLEQHHQPPRSAATGEPGSPVAGRGPIG